VFRIFIALKTPLSSARSEPANLVFSGMQTITRTPPRTSSLLVTPLCTLEKILYYFFTYLSICLPAHGFVNDTVGSSEYRPAASKDRIINE
jgi:hypothetical protein